MGVSVTSEAATPKARNGRVATKPAMGPAAPTSSSCRLVRIGSLMRITAPKVPIGKNGAGAGMKNGGVAHRPWRRQAR